MNTKQFFALLNQMNAVGADRTKEDLVLEQTNGRTNSLKELTPTELSALTNNMKSICATSRKPNNRVTHASDPEAKVKDQMRKKIIACFKSIGLNVQDAKSWAKKQAKKEFNDYSVKELSVLITIAQKVKKSHINSVSNKLKQAAQ